MKITDHSLNTKKTFGELETGDVFRDEDGDILMKINPCYGEDTNCINLKSGEGYSYREEYDVIPFTDVELIIK